MTTTSAHRRRPAPSGRGLIPSDRDALLDTPTTDIGTYDSVVRPDGTIFGEGHGVTMATDGSGTVSWRGQGVSHFTESGGTSFRCAVYFESASDKSAPVTKAA